MLSENTIITCKQFQVPVAIIDTGAVLRGGGLTCPVVHIVEMVDEISVLG